MQLLTNEIDAENVRRETDDGDDYLVAPVVLVRAMQLNGGYLPQREIERSAADWDGVPVPVDHPTDGDEPISITDERADAPVIGEVRNPEPKDGGDRLVGELWLNISDAQAAGQSGERVISRLQNGDALEVSTGYVPGRVVAGQFDGAHRDQAVLDIQPDHLAVLPNDKGRCSLADGCGAGAPKAPAVNQLYVQTIADDGPERPEDDGTESTDTDALRRAYQALRDAFGGTDAPAQSDDEPAESGTDADADADTTTTMNERTRDLVENHDFDAANLPDEDTECFDRIYEAVANDDADEVDDTGEQTDESLDVEAVADELEDRFVTRDDLEDALAANEERKQKQDLAADIVANSDDYDEVDAVLEDFPTVNALEVKRDDVQAEPSTNFAAQRTTRPGDGTSGAEDFPALSASKRTAELNDGGD